MRFVIFFIILVFTSCSNTPKLNNYQSLNKYFDVIEANKKALGTVLTYKDGKIDYARNYGHIEAPNKPIYKIGSITKTYTAVIIAKLVEQGHLKFEDTLSKFYPTLPNSKKITIEHLLQHRSGLKNFTDQKEYSSFFANKITEKDLLKKFVKYGTDFHPGEKYKYSNTGYVILTFIAQKVTNKNYQTLLAEYITNPLGLKNTYVYKKEAPRESEVDSFIKIEKWEKYSMSTHQSAPRGAGAVSASAHDVAKFFDALFHHKIVSEKTLARMTKTKDSYGLGLFKVPFYGKWGIGHNGSIDGFHSIATYFKDIDTVFVHLGNGSAIKFNDISIAQLSATYNKKIKIPTFLPKHSISLKTLNKYVGKFKADNFPLAIKVFLKNNSLYAQADGQGAFPLEAISDTEFTFESAAIHMAFKNSGNSFDFTQGKKFHFKKIE